MAHDILSMFNSNHSSLYLSLSQRYRQRTFSRSFWPLPVVIQPDRVISLSCNMGFPISIPQQPWPQTHHFCSMAMGQMDESWHHLTEIVSVCTEMVYHVHEGRL